MARKKKKQEKRIAEITGKSLIVRDLNHAFLWVLLSVLLTAVLAVIGDRFLY